MLRYERAPLLPLGVLEVHVDEAVAWSVQVGAEGEDAALVGHVGVLRFEIIYQLHPRQQAYVTHTHTIYTRNKGCNKGLYP